MQIVAGRGANNIDLGEAVYSMGDSRSAGHMAGQHRSDIV